MEAWYFSTVDRTLCYGDDRPIIAGETHEVEGALELCSNGLHASVNILDALDYAPGNVLWRVEVSGDILEDGDGDKLCARQRTYLWGFDATEVLLEFARSCALDVIHLWDAPEVVVEYLKTGDESLREKARDAADAAADTPHAAAAHAAAAAADAAYATATATAYSYAAYAAYDAEFAAIRAAHSATSIAVVISARKAQEKRLLEMIEKARKA